MHYFSQIFTKLQSFWKKQSLAQRVTLGYFLLLLIVIVTLPIIQISSIVDSNIESYSLLNSSMLKVAFVIIGILLKLIVRNVWESRRNRVYAIFGFQASIPFINFLSLSICFLLFLSIVDTIGFVEYHISQNITMAWGWAVIASVFLVGMIWQLIIARLQWKQKIKQHDIHTYQSNAHYSQDFYLDKKDQEKLL